MIYIGSHISAAGGFEEMGKTALKLGADTFAFFTRNPRGGKAKDIDQKDVQALITIMEEHHFGPLVAHAPYTMNLCSDKPDIRRFAKDMFAEDIKRMEYLPGNYYNFHPGSHVGQGVENGINYIADAMNEVLFPEMKTIVLLEGMAGKGSEIGRNFEEIRMIIDRVELKDKIGVCLDTCHLWEAGYDVVSDFDKVMDEFDRVVGLDKLYAIHMNDSKNPIAAHKDRHELLGEGHIGKTALEVIIHHPSLQGKPFILETPNDDAGYAEEIAWVRSVME